MRSFQTRSLRDGRHHLVVDDSEQEHLSIILQCCTFIGPYSHPVTTVVCHQILLCLTTSIMAMRMMMRHLRRRASTTRPAWGRSYATAYSAPLRDTTPVGTQMLPLVAAMIAFTSLDDDSSRLEEVSEACHSFIVPS